MAFNLFKKEKPAVKKSQKKTETALTSAPVAAAPTLSLIGRSALHHIYISEKASRVQKFNQYIFAVATKANKPEIKKQVEKRYNVKVTAVNVVNMPEKKRTVGRHVGIRPGFKKAMVTLAEGNSIDQAK